MSDYKKIMNSDETGRFTADIKNETFTVNSDLVNNSLSIHNNSFLNHSQIDKI